MNSSDLNQLLETAVRHQWNLFDLLDELQPVLASRDARVIVAGQDLRAASLRYRLGDHRIDTLFPIDLVQTIEVGQVGQDQPAVDVRLTRPTSGFLELGDFHLATRYGFRSITGRALSDAFGVQVKNGWFTWNLDKVERVPDPRGLGDPNFIAIHLKGFFRPKRWQIDPVTIRPIPPTSKP